MTGNVLRDYLTDLYPILEVGASAKDAFHRASHEWWWFVRSRCPLALHQSMFSNSKKRIIFAGTLWVGFGRSRRLLSICLTGSITPSAGVLGRALDDATTEYLMMNKSPSRQVKTKLIIEESFLPCDLLGKSAVHNSLACLLAKQFTLFSSSFQQMKRRFWMMNGARGAIDVGVTLRQRPT